MAASNALRVMVTDPALDEEAIDEAMTQLRLELLDHEQATTSPVVTAEAAPPGARAVDMVAVGAIVVAVAGGLTAIRDILQLVDGWRRRRGTAQVRVRVGDQEIELSAATEATQEELIRAFLDRIELE